jgi:hypothetical protein
LPVIREELVAAVADRFRYADNPSGILKHRASMSAS